MADVPLSSNGLEPRYPRRALPALLALAAAWSAGCMRYRLGNGALYRRDIETVHVPIFESDVYRRHLGEWLTEAVVKEIALRTPYRTASRAEADSVLLGKITNDAKLPRGFTSTDEPRILDFSLRVEVSWTDRNGRPIHEPCSTPIPAALAQAGTNVPSPAPGELSTPSAATQNTPLVPEFGQSMATAQQSAILQLAQHIVSMMEAPW